MDAQAMLRRIERACPARATMLSGNVAHSTSEAMPLPIAHSNGLARLMSKLEYSHL
jgi:S-adenosylmethionine synthetase